MRRTRGTRGAPCVEKNLRGTNHAPWSQPGLNIQQARHTAPSRARLGDMFASWATAGTRHSAAKISNGVNSKQCWAQKAFPVSDDADGKQAKLGTGREICLGTVI